MLEFCAGKHHGVEPPQALGEVAQRPPASAETAVLTPSVDTCILPPMLVRCPFASVARYERSEDTLALLHSSRTYW